METYSTRHIQYTHAWTIRGGSCLSLCYCCCFCYGCCLVYSFFLPFRHHWTSLRICIIYTFFELRTVGVHTVEVSSLPLSLSLAPNILIIYHYVLIRLLVVLLKPPQLFLPKLFFAVLSFDSIRFCLMVQCFILDAFHTIKFESMKYAHERNEIF